MKHFRTDRRHRRLGYEALEPRMVLSATTPAVGTFPAEGTLPTTEIVSPFSGDRWVPNVGPGSHFAPETSPVVVSEVGNYPPPDDANVQSSQNRRHPNGQSRPELLHLVSDLRLARASNDGVGGDGSLLLSLFSDLNSEEQSAADEAFTSFGAPGPQETEARQVADPPTGLVNDIDDTGNPNDDSSLLNHPFTSASRGHDQVGVQRLSL